jgi:hypothetical protein
MRVTVFRSARHGEQKLLKNVSTLSDLLRLNLASLHTSVPAEQLR